MIGSEFASCWSKIGRAEEHFNTLKPEIITWKETGPYTVTRKCDADGSRHWFVIDIQRPAPLVRSLIAGDCIHNLRSALDTLVYALAVRDSGTNPPPKYKVLQFPITDSSEKFTAEGHRIAPLGNVARAYIEGTQPYNRPHPEFPPLLRLLGEFDNIDKHRLLNIAFANMGQGKVSLAVPEDGRILSIHDHVANRGAIESGTDFVSFTLYPPNPQVDCHYEFAFTISVAHPAGPDGRTFGDLCLLLKTLIAHVTGIINGAVS